MKFGLFSKLYTGLDIGSHAVKVVLIEKRKKVNHLIGWGISDYDKETPTDDEIAMSIQKVYQDSDIPLNRCVWLGISGYSTKVRIVKFPKMSHDELKSTIEWHLAEYFPYPKDEIYYDWTILNTSQEAQGSQKETLVAVVGSKRDLVDRLIDISNKARIYPAGINMIPMALYNTVKSIIGREAVALVDIGAKITTVIIVARQIVCFSRQTEIGGDSLTSALVNELRVERNDAENLKKEESKLINVDTDNLRVFKACQSIFTEILTEIRKSIAFFESESSYGRVVKILLCGGSSLITNIDKLVSKSLKIPAEIFDPLKGIEVSCTKDGEELEKIAPQLATGIGLVEEIWKEGRQ
ncbi:type IV pilus assembly protein PilM [bacterium]|nr:type IV pilus assembly protein PilM [bacterium]